MRSERYRWTRWLVLGVSLALVSGRCAQAGAVEVDFDVHGLSSVRVDGAEWLADAGVLLTRAVAADAYRDIGAEPPTSAYAGDPRVFTELDVSVLESTFDPGNRTLQKVFVWGDLSLVYDRTDAGLNIAVTLRNRSDRVIELMELDLLSLRPPPALAIERVSSLLRFHSDTNIGGPCVYRALHADGQILYLSTIPGQPVRQRFTSGTDALKLTLAAGDERGGREVYHGAWNTLSVRPDKTATIRLSIRFAPREADPYGLVADVWQAFGEAYPLTFHWPDRRPIGELHVADSRRNARNPRGWFVAGHRGFPSATEDAYAEAFRTAKLAYADHVIQVARQLGLQGVFVWQIEGMQEPRHAFYGEPRILPYVAPEMDAVADAFMRRLREAGLRVGVALRPAIQIPFDPTVGSHRGALQGVVRWEAMRAAAQRADWSVQFRNVNWIEAIPEALLDLYDPREADCVLTRLDNKIQYARDRWDATIFYLEDNFFERPRDMRRDDAGWSRLLISAEIRGALQRRHPDVLIIDEHQYPQYFAHGVQRSQPHGMNLATGPDVRAAYPNAVTLIRPGHRIILENLDTYVPAVEDGDILMAVAWYAGDLNLIHTVYGKAAESAPFQIRVSETGISLGEQIISGPAELRAGLTEALQDHPPLRERRAFVRYAEALEPAALQAVLEAITEAGGIIAWTQINDS